MSGRPPRHRPIWRFGWWALLVLSAVISYCVFVVVGR